MRYIEISHTYVIPVPADDVDAIDLIANEGVSIMEAFIRGRASNVEDLRSDWKMMPQSYRPRQLVQDFIDQGGQLRGKLPQELIELNEGEEELEGEITFHEGTVPKFTDTPHERDRVESLYAIEHDLDHGISFTGDIMGQKPKSIHPWDQGVRVTPKGHEMFDAETEALRQEGKLCGYRVAHHHECVLVKGHPGYHLFQSIPHTDVIEGQAKEITNEGEEER